LQGDAQYALEPGNPDQIAGFSRYGDLGADAKFFSRSHDAVMSVYDAAGNVIETHEHKGDFKER
jgi:hypothetical protein